MHVLPLPANKDATADCRVAEDRCNSVSPFFSVLFCSTLYRYLLLSTNTSRHITRATTLFVCVVPGFSSSFLFCSDTGTRGHLTVHKSFLYPLGGDLSKSNVDVVEEKGGNGKKAKKRVEA